MKVLGFEISRLTNVTSKPTENQKAFSRIKKETLSRLKQSISDWVDAIDMAEDVHSPNNEELMRLYKGIILDPHISALMDTMIYQVQSNKFVIYSGDEIDEEKTKLFQNKWFHDFIKHVCLARFYGFSFIQFDGIMNDSFTSITNIPCEYVIPQWQMLKQHPSDYDGIPINRPPLNKWNLFIGDKYDLGLLSKAAPYAIFKREVVQFWAAYNELFGQPVRIGKTDMQDNARKENMKAMLDEMSYAPWAVLHNDDQFEMIAASGVSGEKTYEQNIRLIDEQLSKLFLGQTMVLDSGSSLSQSEVHERQMDSFINAQMKMVKYVTNDDLIPMMINLGFPLGEDDKFEWQNDEKISVIEQADIIAKISPYYKLNKEYVEETLGVVLDEQLEEKPIETKDKKENRPTSIMDQVINYYEGVTNHKHG